MSYFSSLLVNPTAIKKTISIVICSILFSCSSTNENKINYLSDNNYSNGYVKENFSYTHFNFTSENSIKKNLSSDHQLIMSLLNRSMTEDQMMMLTFEQERQSYSEYFSNYAVQIKGDKESDSSNARTNNIYTQLISQDINAIDISAPK